MQEALGWVSSFVLVLTIGKQVYKQWRSGTSEGVSKWLYIGQIAASVGFTLYSWLVHNWVFVVTNGLLLLQALLGAWLHYRFLRADRRRAAAGPQAQAAGEPRGARPAHA
ncbi:hypothetical protein FGE12_21415 [Aggregicoccus sp. 17bor-14]|uniref:hypothetical protein n=1 Tax=Myxococcaceae TaxID=31 RepID=UPI00129D16BD|nr:MULTISPECIES: hypothetical protein [Myxococcaceae]MBF5044975.1 hypothetical protein [Simulacricoccus sp. 17bor-14]MRI90718.1 hypothetical protein [Aggregicoccus sp. 17bor-14]